MKKFAFSALVAALLISGPAIGQTLKYNCTTTGCNFITDPFPPLPTVQPNTCKFLVCNVANCSVNAVKVITPVAGPVGAYYCNFPNQVFTPGTYSVAAVALAADGSESDISKILAFQSSAGAPPAPFLKITSPTVR